MRQYPHWRLRHRRPRAIFACVWIIALASEAERGRDYFVNPSGADGAFPTVQSAVDAVAGQTEIDRANIFIAPGKYVERVTVE